MRVARMGLIAVWLVGVPLTVLHGLHPPGYSLYSRDSSPVLETVAACGATLLAALSYGRWRQSGLAPDVITCAAFGLLAAGNLLFALLPTVTTSDAVPDSVRAAAFMSGAAAALLLMLASLVPERQTRLHRAQTDAPALILAVLVAASAAAIVASYAGGAFAHLSGTSSTEATGSHSGLGIEITDRRGRGVRCRLGPLRAPRRAQQRSVLRMAGRHCGAVGTRPDQLCVHADAYGRHRGDPG